MLLEVIEYNHDMYKMPLLLAKSQAKFGVTLAKRLFS
jgi:hypothetical protein